MADDSLMAELDADIAEFKEILANNAKRANVKKVLQSWVDKCELEKKSMQKIIDAQQPKKIEPKKDDQTTTSSQESPVDVALKAIDNIQYESLQKFGWDQSGSKVQIYITSGVDGIGSLPKGQVVCEFEDQSFDLRIQDLDGRNLRLKIPQTQEALDIGSCKYKIKSNGVTITLLKKDPSKHWTDLKPKKSLVSTDRNKAEKSKNPQGDLMEMMKEMYQNGDDDMKRTIAQSWQKSQDERSEKKNEF